MGRTKAGAKPPVLPLPMAREEDSTARCTKRRRVGAMVVVVVVAAAALVAMKSRVVAAFPARARSMLCDWMVGWMCGSVGVQTDPLLRCRAVSAEQRSDEGLPAAGAFDRSKRPGTSDRSLD